MAHSGAAEAPQPTTSDGRTTTMDDEVIIVEEDHAHRTRAAKHSRLWPLRWGTFEWNRALVLAAVRSGVADFWKDKNNYGKVASTKDRLREAFWRLAATEVSSFDPEREPLESFLHVRSIWSRLQEVLNVYRDAKAYIAGMTETEWQAFLQQGEGPGGQEGTKKQRTVKEYCTLLAWIPAGEDDNRYPSDSELLEKGKQMDLHLQVLLDAMEVHNTGVDQKKVDKGKEALKTVRKDAQSLAAER